MGEKVNHSLKIKKNEKSKSIKKDFGLYILKIYRDISGKKEKLVSKNTNGGRWKTKDES